MIARIARLRPSALSVLSGAILLVALAWAVAPGLLASQDPISGGSTPALLPPSAQHWFGTDEVGRDLYTRVVYGARQTLAGALVAVALGFVAGTLVGVLAGVRRGLVDTLVMRGVDVLLAIPSLLLSLSVIIAVGQGTVQAALAVGVTSVATFARLARSQVLGVMERDYVEAAYGSGATSWQVVYRHVLPNSLTPVVALAAVQFGSAMLQLATLGFLGYGTPPPTPEWGLLIAESRDYIATAGWLTLLPGAVVVAVVLAANHLAHALRKVI
ncbi:ABC transporter permease [Corynebacterium mastitidis]|uniref:ABC transporter permease n=1 Tax=Corynebacterium mastitidis TaxID=161890 RepID=UPI002549F461|nr:ABC transporter permease [Corynebacterium mastitidis]MDK8450944.1 ABC transporter permease [Corynebacterium mastitidis]